MFEEVDLTHIEFAAQDAILALWPQVDRVLQALGHPEAWVGDETTVDDFGPSEAFLRNLSLALGFQVERGDHLYALAFRLKARDNGRPVPKAG
jgi:hypothetical protein